MDCQPTANGKSCRRCGWTYPLDGPFPADLRRKCPQAPSRGLGDTLAKLTRAVGIKPCAGCKRRQRWLNRVFPYRASGG